jgi:hypothetical protein
VNGVIAEWELVIDRILWLNSRVRLRLAGFVKVGPL